MGAEESRRVPMMHQNDIQVLFGIPQHPFHHDPLYFSPFYLIVPWTAAKLGNPPNKWLSGI
jgi:hypothetical protein